MYWVLLLYWVLLDTFTLAQDLCTLSTILYIPVARMMSFVALICRLQRADRYVKSLTCNWHYANYMQITTVACTTVTFGICGSIGGCNKMRDCIFILLTAKEKNHKPLPWLNMNKQVLTDYSFWRYYIDLNLSLWKRLWEVGWIAEVTRHVRSQLSKCHWHDV